MALLRDELGKVDSRDWARPASVEYTGNPLASALKGAGAIAMNLLEGSTAAKVERGINAELEATSRLQGLSDSGASPDEDLFSGMTEDGAAAARSTLAQLEAEAGSAAAAIKQKPLLRKIAMTRLETLVQDAVQKFPGFEPKIHSIVSGHLGFNTRGFAARQILGLDQATPTDSARTQIVVASNKQMYDDINKNLPGGLPSTDLPEDIDQMNAILREVYEPLAQANNVARSVQVLEGSQQIGAIQGQQIVAGFRQSMQSAVMAQVRSAMGALTKAKPGQLADADLARIGQQAVLGLQQYKATFRSGLDSMLAKNNPALLGMIPEDVLLKQEKEFSSTVDSMIAQLNEPTFLKWAVGNQDMAELLTRQDWMKQFPSVLSFAALMGDPGMAMAVTNTGSGQDLANTHINNIAPLLTSGADAAGARMDSASRAGKIVESYKRGGDAEVKRHIAQLDPMEYPAEISGVGYQITNLLGSIKSQDTPDPNAAMEAAIVLYRNTNELGSGRGATRRSTQDRVSLLRAMTEPEVMAKLSPQMLSYVQTLHSTQIEDLVKRVQTTEMPKVEEKAPPVALINGTVHLYNKTEGYDDSVLFSSITPDNAVPRIVPATEENAIAWAEEENRTLPPMMQNLTRESKIAQGRQLISRWNQVSTEAAAMHRNVVAPLLKERDKARRGYQ